MEPKQLWNNPCRLSPAEIHVWCSPLDAPYTCIQKIYNTLSDLEKQRAGALRLPEHRRSFIAAHGLLRTILALYHPTDAERIELAYGPNGKPRLAPEGRVKFNLSHCEDLALVAVNLDRELGIDLERIRPIADLENIARTFFSPGECRDLFSLGFEQRTAAFFTCWTRKEAYVKATGAGLSCPLDSFRVTVVPGENPGFIGIDGSPSEAVNFTLHDVRPSAFHAAALAVERRNYDNTSIVYRKFASMMDCLDHISRCTGSNVLSESSIPNRHF